MFTTNNSCFEWRRIIFNNRFLTRTFTVHLLGHRLNNPPFLLSLRSSWSSLSTLFFTSQNMLSHLGEYLINVAASFAVPWYWTVLHYFLYLRPNEFWNLLFHGTVSKYNLWWVNQKLIYDRIKFYQGQNKWNFCIDKLSFKISSIRYQTFICLNVTILTSCTTSKKVGELQPLSPQPPDSSVPGCSTLIPKVQFEEEISDFLVL